MPHRSSISPVRTTRRRDHGEARFIIPPHDGVVTKERYRVHMYRMANGMRITTTVHTWAWSRDQAERFAHFQKPGFSVVRVVRD